MAGRSSTRSLQHNVAFASIVAVLVIGSIEALSLIGDKFALQGPLWRFVARLSQNLRLVG
jgi:high-affinity nickel permease